MKTVKLDLEHINLFSNHLLGHLMESTRKFFLLFEEKKSILKPIELSNIVFGFVSTVRIEAALLRKPEISLCKTQWSKFYFEYILVELKYLPGLLKQIERNFCKVYKGLRVARFIYILHSLFRKTSLYQIQKYIFLQIVI